MSAAAKRPETPLEIALAQKGMSAAELARLLDTSRQNVARWARGAHRVPKAYIDPISQLLGVPRSDLALGETLEMNQTPIVRSVRIRGIVAAGVWFEEDMAVQYDEEIPVVTGKWSHLEQTGYRVNGPCMDRLRIFDGDYVVAVPYFDARREPTPDDVVVVERKRGNTTERTVKQLALDGSGYLLWPRSSDPRFQTPLAVNQHGEGTESDGTTIEITGLVIFRGGHV